MLSKINLLLPMDNYSVRRLILSKKIYLNYTDSVTVEVMRFDAACGGGEFDAALT
ncbi:hypothetical protein C8R48DRAFT_694744, partial [Suillus tomentosus]